MRVTKPAGGARASWWQRAAGVLLWSALAVLTAWALVRLTGVRPPWPGPALLALTPWVVPAALVGVLAALLLRRRRAALLAGVTAAAVLVVLVPRAVGSGADGSGRALRLLTVNLHVGDAHAERLVRLVRDERVDVLALQEYTPAARRALRHVGLRRVLPYRVVDPEPAAIGSALYARYRLTGGDAGVGPGGFVQVSATVHRPGAAPVAVRSVHPCAPYTAAHLRCWRRGLAAEPSAGHGPVRVLLGDFNATLDHPALRGLLGRGYRDAAAAVGAGLHPTWPADLVPVATLDHVLVDRRVSVRSVATHPVAGTDHRALSATVLLPAAANG